MQSGGMKVGGLTSLSVGCLQGNSSRKGLQLCCFKQRSLVVIQGTRMQDLLLVNTRLPSLTHIDLTQSPASALMILAIQPSIVCVCVRVHVLVCVLSLSGEWDLLRGWVFCKAVFSMILACQLGSASSGQSAGQSGSASPPTLI